MPGLHRGPVRGQGVGDRVARDGQTGALKAAEFFHRKVAALSVLINDQDARGVAHGMRATAHRAHVRHPAYSPNAMGSPESIPSHHKAHWQPRGQGEAV